MELNQILKPLHNKRKNQWGEEMLFANWRSARINIQNDQKQNIYSEANSSQKNVQHPLVTKEIKIKTSLTFHLIPLRMAIIKKIFDDEDVEKDEPSFTASETISCSSLCGNQYVGSSNIELSYIPLFSIHLKDQCHVNTQQRCLYLLLYFLQQHSMEPA